MTEVGTGGIIYELRKQIQKITTELKNLDSSSDIPELIKSANLLRSNEHLVEVNLKMSELISTYKDYSKELEQMLATVFDIQQDLKEILKTQTSLISEQKKSKTKKKSSKK
ncbi:MAG: hypothetical protein IIA19_07595 [Thaumarchaeota archaeon]|nr:hypothetical protein [Nitrososphaerota archaeon]